MKFMSMGLLVKSDQPLIWRGPMAHKALQQCLFDVDWGELDYLMVDLPPGTGDVHLTLAQAVPLTGAVIVSTPQDVGLRISMKTLRMFQQTRVPILGIVENMSYYICPHCNSQDYIFGQGGGSRAAEQLGIPFLGEVPLDLAIRTQSDIGQPIVIAQPDAPSARTLRRSQKRLRRRSASVITRRPFSRSSEGRHSDENQEGQSRRIDDHVGRRTGKPLPRARSPRHVSVRFVQG